MDRPNAPRGLSPEEVGALQRRLHDGLCQHLAASALLQSVVVDRLERLNSSGLFGEDLHQLVENVRQIKTLLYEALDETRTVLRSLD